MTQRVAFATSAALLAFIIVLVGALGAYVALHGPANSTAFASQRAGAATAPEQQSRAQSLPQPPSQGDAPTTNGYALTQDEAANIALTIAPGATLVQQPRLVNLNGAAAYEVVLDRGNVYVDANTGSVLYSTAGGERRRTRRFPR